MLSSILAATSKLSALKTNLYLFPQQGNDSVCHCLFIFNFCLLKQIKYKFTDYVWRTHEDWAGITFSGISAWQIAMNKLTNPSLNDNQAFATYQQQLLKQGIHLENIYTDSGKVYYKSSLNPLSNLQKIWLSPYHFVCAEKHPDAVQKTLPLYSDGKDYFIFDVQNQYYKKLQKVANYFDDLSGELLCLSSGAFGVLKHKKSCVKLTSRDQQYLGLPNYSYLDGYKIKPIFNNNTEFKYGYKYQYLPKQATQNLYFHVGLFQLLNLAMGVDRENNLIDHNHKLYPVYINLREEMNKHPDNPWASSEFCAKNNLEYHLAELFKQDLQLMQEVMQANKYPFNTFEHYENLDYLYNSKDKNTRKSLSDSKLLLPGKEQMLAYSFSQSLLTVWIAAVSEKALYSVLELPVYLRFIFYFANRSYHKKILKTVYNKKDQSRSFIALWQYIKQKLQQQGIEELFSFDGHGVVISFDEQLIKMQNTHMNIVAPKLMQDLGFTVIDSLYADVVKPWYVKYTDY